MVIENISSLIKLWYDFIYTVNKYMLPGYSVTIKNEVRLSHSFAL